MHGSTLPNILGAGAQCDTVQRKAMPCDLSHDVAERCAPAGASGLKLREQRLLATNLDPRSFELFYKFARCRSFAAALDNGLDSFRVEHGTEYLAQIVIKMFRHIFTTFGVPKSNLMHASIAQYVGEVGTPVCAFEQSPLKHIATFYCDVSGFDYFEEGPDIDGHDVLL